MSSDKEKQSSNENRPPLWVGLLPVVVVVAMVYGAARYYLNNAVDNSERALSPATPDEGSLPADTELTSQSQGSTESSQNTLTVSQNRKDGEFHPYTGLFYKYALQPIGYENTTCFTVPQDGTAFGTMLLGGPDNNRLNDISGGTFFKDGKPYTVPLDTPSEQWLELLIVQPGDVGCSW